MTDYVVVPKPDIASAALDDLLDRAFGPGRLAKSSYRLREGVDEISALSFAAYEKDGSDKDGSDGRLVGSIRFWPVVIGEARTPALLLGPLAVEPGLQGKGVGLSLMKHGLAAAAALGHKLVLLVGDLPYYARVGFSQVPMGQVVMPQPVDPARLLWLELEPGASLNVTGDIERALEPVAG